MPRPAPARRMSCGVRGRGSVVRGHVVRIAVQPPLTGLCGRDHRMGAVARVTRGVAVRRGVAAERDAAALTGTEVDPVLALLHALFADALPRGLDAFDSLDVSAARVHTRNLG